MNGAVNANGTLVLQGGANSGTMSLSLSSWTSSASGSSMTGNFSYNATISGLPGVAVVVSRLSGVASGKTTRREGGSDRPRVVSRSRE